MKNLQTAFNVFLFAGAIYVLGAFVFTLMHTLGVI